MDFGHQVFGSGKHPGIGMIDSQRIRKAVGLKRRGGRPGWRIIMYGVRILYCIKLDPKIAWPDANHFHARRRCQGSAMLESEWWEMLWILGIFVMEALWRFYGVLVESGWSLIEVD